MSRTELVNYASNKEATDLAVSACDAGSADLRTNPLIDQCTRIDVATLFTLAKKTSNGYCSSVLRSQLLTSTHISYKVTFLALSHPRDIMLTYSAFNAV